MLRMDAPRDDAPSVLLLYFSRADTCVLRSEMTVPKTS